MRVLLISANQEMLPDPVAPLGLAFLSASLKSAGHEVQCLDLCFEENIEFALKKSILNFSPAVIGLSLRNLDNVSYPESVSYLPFYKRVIEYCRQFSRSPIFLGGAGFTLMPGPLLNYLRADGGFVGEGEEAFPRALEAIPNESAAGGVFRPVGTHSLRPACIQDLDALPSPDWQGLDIKEYFRRGGMGNLQTRRGCPFSCLYCTYPLIEGKRVRLRSPEKVAVEAEFLLERGVENAFIVDNIFNFPEAHAREVCRVFIARRISLKWSCYAHPAHFSRPLAEDLKKAGCTGVEFGADSGAPSVLAKLKKDFSPDHLLRATHIARESGLEVCMSLSLGAPGETEETLAATFALMEKISPTAVIAMVGLRIFPGTGLAELAEAEGTLPPSPDLLKPVFYLAPAVRDRVVEIARKQAALHSNWIWPGLGINVSSRLQSKLRKVGIKGPLWEHMKVIRERRTAKGEPRA